MNNIMKIVKGKLQPIYQSRSLRCTPPGGWFDASNKDEWEESQGHPAYEHRVVYIYKRVGLMTRIFEILFSRWIIL